MAIDKGLYQAPQGIAETEGPDIEIELLTDDGDIGETADGLEHEDIGDDKFNENLAEHIDDGTLQSIASELIGLFDADVAARKIGRIHMSRVLNYLVLSTKKPPNRGQAHVAFIIRCLQKQWSSSNPRLLWRPSLLWVRSKLRLTVKKPRLKRKHPLVLQKT